MGIIKRTIEIPDLYSYIPEFNKDGTEKHVHLDGARFHVLSWSTEGEHCSEPNCEINKHGGSVNAAIARHFPDTPEQDKG